MKRTDDGYDIIPDRSLWEIGDVAKGIQCGKCGVKFDRDKTYGYVCPTALCPLGFGSMS